MGFLASDRAPRQGTVRLVAIAVLTIDFLVLFALLTESEGFTA